MLEFKISETYQGKIPKADNQREVAKIADLELLDYFLETLTVMRDKMINFL